MGEDLFYGNALVDSYFTVKSPDSGLMPVSCPQRIYCQNLVDKYAKLPHYLMSYCYAVTQAQYKAVMGKNPSRFQGEDLSVETVSWHDAQAFCKRLTKISQRKYGLPSEAQWEYACRAGTSNPFYFGETISTNVANYNGNYSYNEGVKGKYLEKTASVKLFGTANEFGLYDMHGNGWEWCEDNWHSSYDGAPTDGSAWVGINNGHVLRGGSWNRDPNNCRSAFREWDGADRCNNSIGFRVMCSTIKTL
jgi:formylglycine-generating enzyme required for sulfatase activity